MIAFADGRRNQENTSLFSLVLYKEELIELAREHLRIGLEQIRNRWIEGSGKSEEEIRAWEAKYLEEILWEWEKENETEETRRQR